MKLQADLPDPDGNLVPNFTFAGIPGGIPEVPTAAKLSEFGGFPDDDLPDDDALDAGIKYLTSKGGGALQLDAGTYQMERPLTIKSNSIVLRGAGMEETKILFTYALRPGEVRLVGLKNGQTVTRNDFIESHVHTRRLKRHQIWVGDTMLYERGPDYSGGNRFDLKLPIAHFSNKIEEGPAMIKSVATRWDGTTSSSTLQVIFDLQGAVVPGEHVDSPKVASIAFVGDRRSIYRGKRSLAQDGKRGDLTLVLNQPSPFKEGDLVILEAESTPRFVESIGSWRKDIPRKQRLIVKEVQGNIIRINQPLRIDFPLVDKPSVYGRRPIRGSGIEDLTLEHTSKQWIDGILFSEALHCWVKGIRVQKAGRNPLSFSGKQGQVEDSEFNEAWYRGGGGTGYLGFSGSCDMLYQRIKATGLRHAPVIQAGASGNVIRDSTFYSSDLNYHMQWPPENLVEQCTIDAKRGTGSYGYAVFVQKPEVAIHGPGGGPRNVLWNNRFKSPRAGIYFGGSVDGWTIAYNYFYIQNGPGVVLRNNASNNLFLHNSFDLKNAAQPIFNFESNDCLENSLIGNIGNSKNMLFEGHAKLAQDSGNQLLPDENIEPQRPPVPSLYQWQLELVKKSP